MKRIFKNTYIATAVIMLAVLSSCEKHEVKKSIDNEIIIGTDFTETKALLDATSFEKSGNRIQIYDFVDNNEDPHIDDLIGPDVEGSAVAESTNGVWPFVKGPHQWTAGVHKFFGWLAEDANMTSTTDAEANTPKEFFGNGFSFKRTITNGIPADVLTIPAKEMKKDTPQFDFMYSNIVTSEPQNEPVDLEFSHLFAAYFFSFSNNSPESLELDNVKLNIKSNASATLDYSGASLPTVNIAFENTQPTIEKTYNSSVGAGKTIDVLITGNELGPEISSDNYRLTWPQDLTGATIEIAFTAKVSIPYYRYNSKGGPYNVYSAEEVDGGSYTWNGSYYVYEGKGKGTHNVLFQHDARGVYEEVIPAATNQEITRSISLASVTKNGKWQGGNKYNYNLSFSNDDVDLKCVVMKWDGGHGGNITFE